MLMTWRWPFQGTACPRTTPPRGTRDAPGGPSDDAPATPPLRPPPSPPAARPPVDLSEVVPRSRRPGGMPLRQLSGDGTYPVVVSEKGPGGLKALARR